MGVLHLTDQDQGGASVAAYRLHNALATARIESEFCVMGRPSNGSALERGAYLEDGNGPTLIEKAVRNLSKKFAHSMRRSRQTELLVSKLGKNRPDVLHLHNLHASALRHEDLAAIRSNIPVVWTMHDCWPWSPWAYRWEDESGGVHTQGEERCSEEDALADRFRFFDERNNTVLVSPSRWLADEAQHLFNGRVGVSVIPYGVPCDVFAPIEKDRAKTLIGLNPARTWIGLSAASFDRRKGADILMDALGILSRTDLGLVIWGNSRDIKVTESVEIFAAGYVSNEMHQAMLYSACDLFVCPSRIDNLPNTILESMACGTPVVASNVGGIADMVRPGDTGWLYSPNNPQACAAALGEALQSKKKWQLYGEQSRRTATVEYSPDLQASRYASLYQEVINRRMETKTTAG
jgi:glycosyltransferase involved in cell wall biosynthesis